MACEAVRGGQFSDADNTRLAKAALRHEGFVEEEDRVRNTRDNARNKRSDMEDSEEARRAGAAGD